MKLSEEKTEEINRLCNRFRRDVLTVLHEKQSGHIGGSFSACEILATLYLAEMNVKTENISDPDRDRLVLCKGHAAPMLYRVLAEIGLFPISEMDTLRDIDSRLQGHPCSLDTPGVEISSGPLGIGLSAALGMALGLRLNNSPARVYAVLGDGELNEGTVWEACMSAYKYKADNLCAVLDWNGVQLDGTAEEIMPMGDIRAKFTAFGWHCVECRGHDPAALCAAYDEARGFRGAPSVILAHTVKGKGVSFMEGKNIWHGKAINDGEFENAMRELEAPKYA